MLCVTRPDVVLELHRSFLDVGVDVVETNSFGSLPTVLAEYQIADRAEELATASARLAREVASGYSTPDRPRYVAGSMGPGTKLPTLGQVAFNDLRDAYEVLARGLLAGGVDLLLVETCYDLLQAKAAIQACRRAMHHAGRKVPIQVQVTIEITGRMLLGTEIGAALCTLDAMKPDVLGMNCATGPVEMYESLHHLSEQCRMPISAPPQCRPPLGPRREDALRPVARRARRAPLDVRAGARRVGHWRVLWHDSRAPRQGGRGLRRPRAGPPVPGSRAVGSLALLGGTLRAGAFVSRHRRADECQRLEALPRRDARGRLGHDGHNGARPGARRGPSARRMRRLHGRRRCGGHDGGGAPFRTASRPYRSSSTPPRLPSRRRPCSGSAGRPVLNSVNLEDGDAPGTRLDLFLSLARDYGAAVICTCIDTEGQARTADWKVRAARAIHDLAVERYGLEPCDLLFDPLALPLSTGMEESRRDGIETIEAIRRIKVELPGVHTVLGLSNVSFGLSPAARQLLNSVFLHECVQAGLDAAIVHAGKIQPLHKISDSDRDICLDLIYDRRREGYDPLSALIEAFEGESAASHSAIEDRSGWTLERRLEQRIVDGDRNGLEAELDQALEAGHSPLGIVNEMLLAGMRTVGELFGSGQMQLPFVLGSAETMKAAVAHLEPHMERTESGGRGRIVLGTVKGDVHDIGKNLVDIILTNNGYEVHNLGIKVPLSELLAKADEVEADAIGMSGLLVKSTLIMRDNLQELNRLEKSSYPIVLGGAALTRTYVEKDLRAIYKGRVFYGKDAFEGLHLLDRLMEIKRSGVDDPSFGTELSGRKLPPRRSQQVAEIDPATLPARSPEVGMDNELFKPPFLGTRVAKGIPLDDIASYINETALFRNQWGYRPEPGEKDADFKERIRAELAGASRRGEGRRRARPPGCLGLLPRQRRRGRSRRLHRRRARHRAHTVLLPAPAQGALPVHRGLLQAGRFGDS